MTQQDALQALLADVQETASVLESAAKHNREHGRTVFAHAQQERAERLRAHLENFKGDTK